MNERDFIFRCWAPEASPWSVWAKPVLFAHLAVGETRAADAAISTSPEAEAFSTFVPPADGRVTVVVDLPAGRAVQLGVFLARLGYTPVPLFNAMPGQRMSGALSLPASQEHVVVELWPAMISLASGAALIEDCRLAPDAPPAFLLDSDRRTGRREKRVIDAGDFDNRSVSFPTDFPSATFLRTRGIRRVVLIQSGDTAPQSDLAHTLRRWQDAGLPVLSIDLARPDQPILIQVGKPRGYRFLWHQLLVTLRLKRNPLGGFGGLLPLPGSSG